MAKIEIPEFKDQFDLFDFLLENKSLHLAEKKSTLKKADNVFYTFPVAINKSEIKKVEDTGKLTVKSVINTTRILDSHSDVHIDGIWNKSLKENKELFLLQEHKMDFEHLISDQVKGFVEMMSFKDLGFRRFKGDTQALIFNSVIDKMENEFMFKRYLRGAVKNHSVGMRYVKLFLAINNDSQDFKEEKEIWDRYADIVVNRKALNDQGFFWAVPEAKADEGSAVIKGSNFATPTMSVESKEDIEPLEGTQKTEPSADTLNRRRVY